MGAQGGPTLDEQRGFWDWHWDHGDERKVVNAWKDQRHAVVLDYIRGLGLSQPRILDIGCGTGWYTRHLAQCGPTTAIDLSERAITEARARWPGIDFRVGNVYDDVLPAAHFDVVVAQEVFDHVPDQDLFLVRAAQALKPGGHFVVSCTNRFVMERVTPGQFLQSPREHVCRYLTSRELRRKLSRVFEVLRTTSVVPLGHRGLLRVANSVSVNRALGWFVGPKRLDAWKARAGLYYQILALARKPG